MLRKWTFVKFYLLNGRFGAENGQFAGVFNKKVFFDTE